jgi:hypothetical protein
VFLGPKEREKILAVTKQFFTLLQKAQEQNNILDTRQKV